MGIENQEPFSPQTRMFALLWERVYFRNAMKKSSVHLCESVSNFSLCLGAFVAGTQSIKNNKLCKTNPIPEKPKMNLTFYSIKDYENKSGLLTPAKQTQSNPIYGEQSRTTCSELVEPISKGTLTQGRSVGFRIEISLLVFVEDDGLGWAEEFISYSTPNNGSAKGG